MPGFERRRDRARSAARHAASSIASEVRHARLATGLSIAGAAASVGLHPSTFGRIERDELTAVTLEQLALACAAIGYRLSLRAYPADDPARDVGQLRLLARFRDRLPRDIEWHTEVPLPIAADPRALDGLIVLPGGDVAVEAEARLDDLQALDRRIQLKKRDARVARLILLVADTRANRATLARHREGLRGNYPLDGATILSALGRHALPEGDGIVIL